MLLYLFLAPLLLAVMFSRINGARKLMLTMILFIGGYMYIMFREATKHYGDRARKRQFLERVAPRRGSSPNGGYSSGGYSSGGGQMKQQPYSGGNSMSPQPYQRGNSYGSDYGGKPSQQRQYSSGSQGSRY